MDFQWIVKGFRKDFKVEILDKTCRIHPARGWAPSFSWERKGHDYLYFPYKGEGGGFSLEGKGDGNLSSP